MEQLMDFEEKHSNYLFDHLTILPFTDIRDGGRDDYPRWPTCVTVDPYTGHFYVVGERHDDCILVYIITESGNIISIFLRVGLRCPSSIAIHQDNLYITLTNKPYLVHFKVADDLHLIRSKEDIGSDVNEYLQFRRLAVSINRDVYVTDCTKHYVQILDGDLNYKHRISHYSMIHPIDVKLTADEVFVLSRNPLHSRYCILVFDQMGSILRSIIPRGLQIQIRSLMASLSCPVFCLDSDGNFIINDTDPDEVKFFTKEGTLFQKLGESEGKPGMFNYITGMTLTANHKLVVVSIRAYFRMQIFSFTQF